MYNKDDTRGSISAQHEVHHVTYEYGRLVHFVFARCPCGNCLVFVGTTKCAFLMAQTSSNHLGYSCDLTVIDLGFFLLDSILLETSKRISLWQRQLTNCDCLERRLRLSGHFVRSHELANGIFAGFRTYRLRIANYAPDEGYVECATCKVCRGRSCWSLQGG